MGELTGVERTVVLDTSALISDPGILDELDGTEVVVPLTVIEELDGLKHRRDEVGAHARSALRRLEGDTGDRIRIEVNGLHLSRISDAGLDPTKNDNRILAAALGQAEGHRPDGAGQARRVEVISNDTAMRVKARHLGLATSEWTPVRARPVGAGWRTAAAPSEMIDALYDGWLDVADPRWEAVTTGTGPNEGLVLQAGSQSVLARVHADGTLRRVSGPRTVWDLSPRSAEQRFALDLLCDPEVPVVALDGRAGTGKTILSIAAGLHQSVEERAYDRVLVFRPVVPVGRQELGFLPGSLDDKLDPWMAAIEYNLVALASGGDRASAKATYDQLTSTGQLQMDAVTHLRGRSIQRSFIIVDELQNLEVSTLKTILTRVGEGTKVVFTGDLEQIDNPFLSPDNNAMSALITSLGGQGLFGHVRLVRCERSPVAELAAELL